MNAPLLTTENTGSTEGRLLRAVRAWLGRWLVCARWDMRAKVLVETCKVDIRAITTALAVLVTGLVGVPYAIIHALLRWPCRPFYWAWLAWRKPEVVDRAGEVIREISNIVGGKGENK